MRSRTIPLWALLTGALFANVANAQVLTQQPAKRPVTAAAVPVAPAEPQTPPPSTVPSRPSKVVDLRTSAAGVTAVLTAPGDVIEVGQDLPFQLTITAEAAVTLTPLDLAESLGAFDLRESDRVSSRDGERRVTTVHFVATTYASGQLELPTIEIAFKSADGAAHTLSIGPLPIEVVSLVGAEFDPNNYRDIKGAVAINQGGWLWWIVAGVLALVIAALAVLTIRRRKAANLRVLTADEWANQELELLAREGLIERGEVHRFWVRLSGTLREYVERQFAIAAPEQTTKEFLAQAAAHPAIDASHRHMLARFLSAADMVKFAAHEPPQDECRNGLASAHDFVRDTTPVRTDVTLPTGAAV
ncbi:MAG: hypothetical protein EXS17_00230 [Phycisphaerales bacterium]|nr:hypothetical protein [Phycisphaerales bacterium]